MKQVSGSVMAGAAIVVVIAAVVGGLFVLGSPSEERARRFDDRRVTDLRGIMAATNLYWTRHVGLPESLDDLVAEPGVRISTQDPATAQPYAYAAVDSIRYELCATFEQESGEISLEPTRDLWAHGPGRQCFQLEVEEVTGTER